MTDVVDPAWLAAQPADPDLEALVELAARACGVPTAVINLLDDRLQHQIAAVGFEPADCAREDSMCAVSVVEPEPVAVVDARCDPRFAANPFVTGEIAEVRFYAAAQLHTGGGEVLGTLCVFDTAPRVLDDVQQRTLRLLAHQVVDVLELRRTTRLLREAVTDLDAARAELTRSNVELAAFAGQVGHDVRGPLTVLTIVLETLADDPAVGSLPAAAKLLSRGGAAADRMAALLDDLLGYARVGGTLRRRPVPLADLVRAAAEDAGLDDGLQVGALPTVRADATQLRIVVQNVLQNARKFAHPDRPLQVDVRGERRAEGWRVEFADNGVGIPADRCDEALRPLTRVHADLPVGGSGLGLATCVRILAAHGGVFGVEPGDPGTVAWFTIAD